MCDFHFFFVQISLHFAAQLERLPMRYVIEMQQDTFGKIIFNCSLRQRYTSCRNEKSWMMMHFITFNDCHNFDHRH